jgi:hypothetical protein
MVIDEGRNKPYPTLLTNGWALVEFLRHHAPELPSIYGIPCSLSPITLLCRAFFLLPNDLRKSRGEEMSNPVSSEDN